MQIEELSERTEGLNSENIKLISALKAAQSKVSTLEDCVCDFEDSATQTSVKTTSSVGTVTDNIIQVRGGGLYFSMVKIINKKQTAEKN